MVEKYFDGKWPDAERTSGIPLVGQLKMKLSSLDSILGKTVPQFEFTSALSAIWDVIGASNKLIEESKPWILYKEGRMEELSAVIECLLEVLRVTGAMIYPFMPYTAAKIMSQLGIQDKAAQESLSGTRTASTRVGKAVPIFPRLDNGK